MEKRKTEREMKGAIELIDFLNLKLKDKTIKGKAELSRILKVREMTIPQILKRKYELKQNHILNIIKYFEEDYIISPAMVEVLPKRYEKKSIDGM